jgi:uncharacterized OB-fold protein
MTMPLVELPHARRYPPRVTDFTRSFWEALAEGRFLVTRCEACARHSFPPKPICPHCWTDAIVWEEQTTEGHIYSWTRVHAGPAIFEADLPYAIGIVDLDCGVRLACPLVGDALWACGMSVELVRIRYTDGPFFGAQAKKVSHN